MKLAIQEAKIAAMKNCVPVGAVLISENEFVAKAHNGEFWHAEILCIQKAQKSLGIKLTKATLFVTIEPCTMCMHAIKLSRIKTVVFGADNKNEPLPSPEVIGGICEDEAKLIMKEFFCVKRQEKR